MYTTLIKLEEPLQSTTATTVDSNQNKDNLLEKSGVTMKGTNGYRVGDSRLRLYR